MAIDRIKSWQAGLAQMGDLVRQVRQSHALEHATIHILSQRYPGLQLMGRSTPGSFYLYGDVPTDLAASAASEALARLQAGEMALAVHPRCGTNLAVSALLAGTAAMLAIGRRRRSFWMQAPDVFLAVSLALFLAQPLGYSVQSRITTLTDVRDVRIASICRQSLGQRIAHRIDLQRD